jgi:DNA ligase (NAD+)
VNKQAQDLNDRILAAQKAYYNGDDAGMTDAEFDLLEQQLRVLDPTAPALLKPGNSGTGRIKHNHPMLSIENQYTEEDVLAWIKKLPDDVLVSLEPKFDGVSCSLIYKFGQLVQALTRGDGESGEDITAQVKATKIPQTLQHPLNIEVRGELVMKNSTLDRINKQILAEGKKPYSSTRNLTAGTMKTSDLKVVAERSIELRPWDVIGNGTIPGSGMDGEFPDSACDRLKMLEANGFAAPLVVVLKKEDTDGIIKVLRTKLEERESILRAKHSLETDGVVIKVDSHKVRKQLGVASKYTNYQVCFKPQSAMGETYLREVIWQVGRQGKLTPVGIIEPLTLAGAVITRVNLNNITWIEQMGIKVNSRVTVCRSGDVIPIIVRVSGEDI